MAQVTVGIVVGGYEGFGHENPQEEDDRERHGPDPCHYIEDHQCWQGLGKGRLSIWSGR